MSERSASTVAVLVEGPVARTGGALLAAAQHVLVLERRRVHLAVAGALEARAQAVARCARSSRISSGSTSRVPGGIGVCHARGLLALTATRHALGGHALDARAERPQPLVDPLVAAVDLADVADLGRALGAQRRDEHRHAGPDVRALHALAVKPARAAYDRAMRVADDHPSAHGDELVHEERAGSRTSSRGSAPGRRPAWPSRARCWSGRPGRPATGRPRSSRRRRPRPTSRAAAGRRARSRRCPRTRCRHAEALERQPGHAQVVGGRSP